MIDLLAISVGLEWILSCWLGVCNPMAAKSQSVWSAVIWRTSSQWIYATQHGGLSTAWGLLMSLLVCQFCWGDWPVQVLVHTLSSPNTSRYRDMMNALFSQQPSAVLDYTYDMQFHQKVVHRCVCKANWRSQWVLCLCRLRSPLCRPDCNRLYESDWQCFVLDMVWSYSLQLVKSSMARYIYLIVQVRLK